MKFILAMLTCAFFAQASHAGTTVCSDRFGHWTFKQWLSDGGAPPPEDMEAPHWFRMNIEQLSADAQWLEHTRELMGTRKIDDDYLIDAYSIEAQIEGKNVEMYCYSERYVGPPRP